EVVLAELAGGVAERLECLGNGDVLRLQAECCAWQADLGHAGTQAGLAGDERCATRRAALLGGVVGGHPAIFGNTVDVRRLDSNQAERIRTDSRKADIVAPDDEDVRSPAGRRRLRLRLRYHARRACPERSGGRRQRGAAKQDAAAAGGAILPILVA